MTQLYQVHWPPRGHGYVLLTDQVQSGGAEARGVAAAAPGPATGLAESRNVCAGPPCSLRACVRQGSQPVLAVAAHHLEAICFSPAV